MVKRGRVRILNFSLKDSTFFMGGIVLGGNVILLSVDQGSRVPNRLSSRALFERSLYKKSKLNEIKKRIKILLF